MSDIIKVDIVDQLIQDIRDNLTVANGYNYEPKEIKVGPSIEQDFKVFPAIAIWPYDAPITESLLNDTYVEELTFYIDLLIKVNTTSRTENYKTIFKYERDFNKFIRDESHWTYKSATVWRKSGPFYLGSVHDPIAQTRVEMTVSVLE